MKVSCSGSPICKQLDVQLHEAGASWPIIGSRVTCMLGEPIVNIYLDRRLWHSRRRITLPVSQSASLRTSSSSFIAGFHRQVQLTLGPELAFGDRRPSRVSLLSAPTPPWLSRKSSRQASPSSTLRPSTRATPTRLPRRPRKCTRPSRQSASPTSRTTACRSGSSTGPWSGAGSSLRCRRATKTRRRTRRTADTTAATRAWGARRRRR